MCAHVLANEQFRLFGVILLNPDFPFWILPQSIVPEASRQNLECKAWDQACDQGVVLLSTASVITIVNIWPWNNQPSARTREGLCVCSLSLFCLLALLGIQREDISSYSTGNAVKQKSFFSSKVRSVLNLPRLSQPFSSCAMFPYTSP